MTEAEIERVVEREMNRLDRELLSGSITQEEYDHEVVQLEKWATEEYRGNK
jgi:Ni,Fe-hydrogenase III large subunit